MIKNLTYLWIQILSITCDNASNNDTMISELGDLLDEFPGAANQTRCFTHVINLVVKSILRQFDVPKAKANETLNNATETLLQVAENIAGEDSDEMTGDDDLEDNTEGWVDERDFMTEEDRVVLDASVQPVRLVLTR
jgi:nucleoside-diphosphate-sugar epimerase